MEVQLELGDRGHGQARAVVERPAHALTDQLELVGGSEPALKLAATHAPDGDTFDAATVAAANAALAKLGVQSFDGALELKPGGKIDLGKGATLAWTAKLKDKGGNNTAPHADSRDLAFDANGSLLESDDGGVYRRTNPTGAGSWSGSWGAPSSASRSGGAEAATQSSRSEYAPPR